MLEKIFLFYVDASVTCSVIALLCSHSLRSWIYRNILGLIGKIVAFLKGEPAKKVAFEYEKAPRCVFSYHTKVFMWTFLCIPMFIPFRIPIPQVIQGTSAESNVVVHFITDKRLFQEGLISGHTFSAGGSEIAVVTVLAYIWILVVTVALFISLFSQIQTRKEMIRFGRRIVKGRRWEIFNRIKQEYNITRPIKLTEYSDVVSPMIIGVLKSIVIVPVKECSDAMFEMMLRHELSHYRRGDLTTRFFSLIISILHWFNPVVRFMMDCMKQDIECACDADALERKSPSERLKYRTLFLQFIEETQNAPKKQRGLQLRVLYGMGRVEERLYLMNNPIPRATGKQYLYVMSFFVFCSFFTLGNNGTGITANMLVDIPPIPEIRVDSHDVQDQTIKSEPREESLDVVDEMIFPVENPTGIVRPFRFAKLEDQVMNGLFFHVPYGTEVHAPISGEIIEAGYLSSATGNVLTIKGEKLIVSVWHLMPGDFLVGDHVVQNDIIGKAGGTGKVRQVGCELVINDIEGNAVDLSTFSDVDEK